MPRRFTADRGEWRFTSNDVDRFGRKPALTEAAILLDVASQTRILECHLRSQNKASVRREASVRSRGPCARNARFHNGALGWRAYRAINGTNPANPRTLRRSRAACTPHRWVHDPQNM